MGTDKKPAKPTLVLSGIIAVLALAVVFLAVLAFWPEEREAGTETGPPTVKVETPYCDLHYPEAWKDDMTVQASSADGIRSETFSASLGGKTYPLYTVSFGEGAKGELFGYLPYEGKQIPVYIECHRLPEDADLSEGERTQFYSMMEGVNQAANAIEGTPGYKKP